MTNAIENMINLTKTGYSEALICNPFYLKVCSEQQEKSMYGQGIKFLKFHRFVFNLSNDEIDNLLNKYKIKKAKTAKDFPDDVFCDMLLVKDALDYQIVIRNKENITLITEIAQSFNHNAEISKDFEEVTADHLIALIKQITGDIN